MKRLLLALPLVLAATTALAQARITAENPASHGWFLGDELVQRLRILLPEGARLDMASLPRPREVEYWLELSAVRPREIPGGVEVELRWLNFYAALQADRREVPPSPIRILDAQGVATQARLPGFAFVASPLRPLLAPTSPEEMKPDPPYRLSDPRPNRIGAALSLLAALICAAALAWTQAWPPFRKRADRPLTRAARFMARAPRAEADDLRRLLHRGLDGAYGGSLIGADLGEFLNRSPQFRPLAERLAEFFAASDSAFFGEGSARRDPAEIRALARDLAAVERRRR
ncbi:nonribosomal peptide synthetase MxaA [Neomegalonema sp.]|uniref:nonribosomal peptide synthetase MxaA n=1 Tax=Neomegalonema sp. TaxID=2039713 RepID=UPI00261E2773|nr:nonribosomal peptide synthetase MxaA [Neomegalonema sp.]MDD2869759.1 nonribosomal peptide synthetase MxaA [Neomegalonema sp.]